MRDAETREWVPTQARTLWLAASLGLVLVPHAPRLPIWVTIGFAVFALWRVAHVLRGVKLPGKWVRLALSLVVVIGVFTHYGTLLGRNAGIAALAVLAGLKLLETDTLRDAYAAVFLGFFLVITNFLYSQSIPTGFYMLFVVTVTTATLIVINDSRTETSHPLEPLKAAGVLLGQAGPLMIVLFLLFPRIPGPLWGLPKDAESGTSGLSETMSPGAISQLGLSTAVAFRVQFEGPPPPPSKLYWRGPVFWQTDGKTWSPGEVSVGRTMPELAHPGRPVYYHLTLEPHQQHWIFALDVPATISPSLRVSDDYQLLSAMRVRERSAFSLRSYPDAQMIRLTDAQRRLALALPAKAHPRARALAAEWAQSARRPEDVIQRAWAYFRNEPFFYTLRPPLLLDDPVDEFLFESRRGFCEHYASAFAVLMRAAGIPTRIVTGYQGGEVNRLGDYLIVRQRDAHAWAEVWLDGRGWVRVDPTAAVSPQRIELGMDAALPTTLGPAALGIEVRGPIADLFRDLRLGWDSINNGWNQWVLGYGPGRQHELLSSLGIDRGGWRALALYSLSCVIVLIGGVALVLLGRRSRHDQVQLAYLRFCRKMSGCGLARGIAEGPHDFSRRIAAARPDLRRDVERITDLYVQLRYAEADGDVRDLRRAVASLRPRAEADILSRGSGA